MSKKIFAGIICIGLILFHSAGASALDLKGILDTASDILKAVAPSDADMKNTAPSRQSDSPNTPARENRPSMAREKKQGVKTEKAGASAPDLNGMLDAAFDMFKAVALSDTDMKSVAAVASRRSDSKNDLAPENSPSMARVTKIMKGMKTEKPVGLNVAVYLTQEVNAFAMADGSVRLYSGLLDMMTDDEVRYVIGHEAGHVALGHVQSALKAAYATSALKKGMAASGNDIMKTISKSELADITEKLVHSQYSQANEREADQYALRLMKLNNYDPRATVSALLKLDDLSGRRGGSLLASHPAPRERAEALEKDLAGNYRPKDL